MNRLRLDFALFLLVAACVLPAGAADQAASQATTAATRTQATTAIGEGYRLFTDAPAEHQMVAIGSLVPAAEGPKPYLFQVELSSRGAGVYTAKLAEYFVTVADKMQYDKNPQTYEAALASDPKLKGHYSLLNPVGTEKGAGRLALATARVQINADGWDKPAAVRLDKLDWRPGSVETAADSQKVSFEVTIYRGPTQADAKPLLKLVKTYTVNRDDYSIHMSLAIENLTPQALRVTLDQFGPSGVPREDQRAEDRQAAYANLIAADKKVQNHLKNGSQIDKLPLNEKTWLGSSDLKDPVLWVGVIDKFFGSMMYLQPENPAAGWLGAPSWRANFFVQPAMESQTTRACLTGVEIPDLQLDPGATRTVSFAVFVGPKKRDLFTNEQAPHYNPLYKSLNYIGTIDFGSWCTFSWLALWMMWLLEVFSKLSFGNYGVAIIILVLLVRLIMHPLTRKSQVSMMGMQKLGPKVQQLKEKYADNKEALNREMAALYKEQGPAQLMGCLPMFLQMPIWFALYSGLNASVELRHAAMLPVWITDLAAPDALFTFSSSIPLIGNTFNLLPFLLCIAMYLQTKFTPQAAATTPEQVQQQKMMKIMMPGMMLFFFYHMPSGLTLYIMASTFAGLIDQHYVRKHIERKTAEEAAAGTMVVVPGKTLRSNRPKKPKGPFWTKKG